MIDRKMMLCRKLRRFFLSTVVILTIVLIGFTSCIRTTIVHVPYIPPSYLDCIEVSTLQLANYYFQHYTASIADEVFKGKAIIIKNVKLTQPGRLNTAGIN